MARHEQFWRNVRGSRLGRVGLGLFVLCWINMASCAIIASILGGDAVPGLRENGRFYIQDHGYRTEVSKRTFWYSRVHTISMLAMLPVGIAGWVMMFIAGTRPLKGVCEHCGYTLAGLPAGAPCPECGTTIPCSAMDSIAVPAQDQDAARPTTPPGPLDTPGGNSTGAAHEQG